MAKSFKEQLATLTAEEVEDILDGLSDQEIIEMGRDEWWYTQRPEQVPPEGPWTIHMYLGGRGCVAPWTMIYLADQDKWERIDALAAADVPITVLSLKDGREISAATDGPPFLKGDADYWHVTLEDGRCITTTDQHRFLTPHGWRQLGTLRAGQLLRSSVLAPGGTAWPCPYESHEDVPHSRRTGADSRDGYPMDHRSDDPQPPAGSGIFPVHSPSRGDVDEHIRFLSHGGGQVDVPGCSRVHPSADPRSRKNSDRGEPSPAIGQGRASSSAVESPLRTLLDRQPSLSSTFPDRADHEAGTRRFSPDAPGKFSEHQRESDLDHEEVLPSLEDDAVSPDIGRSVTDRSTGRSRQLRSEVESGLWEDSVSQANDTSWVGITSIQRMGHGPYYDMTVPETENYVSNGLVSHNTGKTKSGAEWLVQRCIDHPYTDAGHPAARLVVAYNLSDTRTTCIEGDSGILTVLHRRGYEPDSGYLYVKSPKPCITLLDTGARIHFTGADPNAIRGFNLADVWMDEPVKWADPAQVWKEGIYPALRSNLPGDKPRAFITTTPKPIPFIQDMAKRFTKPDNKFVSMSRGSTFDNASNLSSEFIQEIATEYEGTALGRQELYGELLDDIVGPLFSFGVIERNRLTAIPADIELEHITVGVDPCLTGGEEGDFMGVVVAARGTDKHLYVLADETVKKTGRDAAVHIWKTLSTYKADTVVVESNLGKQWLKEVLERTYVELAQTGFFPAYTTPPLTLVHSNHGKKLRAEPVSLRYQQNRVHHLDRYEKLEQEMITFDPLKSKASPDRLDALVHACRHLMEGEGHTVRIFSPVRRKITGL